MLISSLDMTSSPPNVVTPEKQSPNDDACEKSVCVAGGGLVTNSTLGSQKGIDPRSDESYPSPIEVQCDTSEYATPNIISPVQAGASAIRGAADSKRKEKVPYKVKEQAGLRADETTRDHPANGFHQHDRLNLFRWILSEEDLLLETMQPDNACPFPRRSWLVANASCIFVQTIMIYLVVVIITHLVKTVMFTRKSCASDTSVGSSTTAAVDPVEEKLDTSRTLFIDGDYDGALEELYKGLAISQEALEKAQIDSATCHNDIGVILQKQGNHKQALRQHRKALAMCKAVFGKTHPDVAECHNNIGLVFEEQKRYDEALVHYHKALSIHKAVRGKNHPDTASSYNHIGLVLNRQGNYTAALEEFEKSLSIRKSTLGKDHPDTAESYKNIGVALANWDDYSASVVELEKALEICQAAVGNDHPDTAIVHYSIGLALAKEGSHVDAWASFRKALAIREEVLGLTHPQTVATRKSMKEMETKIRLCS